MRSDVPKLIDTDEGQFHYCIKCEDYKSLENFYKEPKTSTGYQGTCRSCRQDRWRELNPEPIPDDVALSIILGKMGYDTKADKTIHEQFIEHALDKYGVDLLSLNIRNATRKYSHLNPPKSGTKEYARWYSKMIRNREPK